MISPVSSSSPTPTSAIQQQQAKQPSPSANPPQDTVHLSSEALAAAKGGDVDHDGDSH
jgi:hypothetical protein